MIYLRKYNNDQPINSYPNLYDYLHNKMESVNDYCSRIKKESFSKELNEDISWHLYQLMDIFCNCQILYDWNCSPTPLTKALLFCSLKSKKKINRILADCTGKSEEQIAADVERDHYLSADEALEYGLIDNIFKSH